MRSVSFKFYFFIFYVNNIFFMFLMHNENMFHFKLTIFLREQCQKFVHFNDWPMEEITRCSTDHVFRLRWIHSVNSVSRQKNFDWIKFLFLRFILCFFPRFKDATNVEFGRNGDKFPRCSFSWRDHSFLSMQWNHYQFHLTIYHS